MKKTWCMATGLLVAFALWTAMVCTVDVQAIGPRESEVGLATVNELAHSLTGVHMTLYVITDWLGLVPIAVCLGFAIGGLCQWIRRRRIEEVDADILLLGGFYIVTVAAYVLFESIPVNYRPVLINDFLETSYPSSTTLLVLCVMPTAIWQWQRRIRHAVWRRTVLTVTVAFTAFMVIGRLLSGVHWLSDIIGGGLLSSGLVLLYVALCQAIEQRRPTA